MKRVLTSFLLLTGLTGLAWGQETTDPWPEPPQQLPQQFRNEVDPVGESIGDLTWFQIFDDPQLHALLKTALERNVDLQIALGRVEAARAQAGITGAQQWPQIGLTAGLRQNYTSANDPNFVAGFLPQNRSFGEIMLNLLSFEFDIWGRLRHQTDAAIAQAVATEYDRRAVMTMVLSEVATSYFNLLDLDAELDVARRTLESRQQSLDLIRTRFEGGVSSQLELRQAEQLVLAAALTIPQAESQVTQLENRIQQLLGNMPGPVARGKSLLEQAKLPAVPTGLTSDLLGRRPDIRSAQAVLIAQQHLLKSAKVSWLPRLTLTAAFGLQSKSAGSLFNWDSHTFNLNPAISMPVFDAGLTHYINQANANQRVSFLQYTQVVQTAFREVADALIVYIKVRQLREGRELLVNTIKDRTELAYMRYRGGIDSLLNALDSDRDLFTAEVQLIQSRRDELLSIVQLYRALGGGWDLGQVSDTSNSNNREPIRSKDNSSQLAPSN